MKIGKISISELEDIAKLLVEQCPGREFDEAKEHTEWHLKAFPEFCLKAEEDGKVLGFIITHLHENALEIEEFYAIKGYENVWKSLIEEVLKKSRKLKT